MIGMLGILGCVIGVMIASVVVSAVGATYGIYSSYEAGERQEAADAKAAENQKQADYIQKRQQRKALVRASQMAASGTMLDRIKKAKVAREIQQVNEKLKQGQPSGAVPRPPRDYGTPVTQEGTIKL